MKICLLGSMKFLPQKEMIAKHLESLGHEVEYSHQDAHMMKPFKDWKEKLMKEHVKRIEWSNAVLIVNFPRERDLNYWVESYIGGNTLGEIFIAWYLGRRLYSWFEIPQGHPYFEELDNMGIRIWKEKDLCKHDDSEYEKLTRNYEVCNKCGNVRSIESKGKT